MDPFATALNRIFTHPHFGVSAEFYRVADQAPPEPGQVVRILLRQPDTIGSYGDTQIIAETTLVEVRCADVTSAPVSGDYFMIGARKIWVLGAAHRDSARLTWVCEARE